jgi:hypothetical protein
MTVAETSRTDVAGDHASKFDARSAMNVDSDQVIVLVRLPYLPSAAGCSRNQGTQSGVSGVRLKKDVDVPPSTPAARQASEPIEGIESLLPRWMAGLAVVVADSRRYLAGIRVSPWIWQAVGFGVAVVLILSALLLLRGGTPSGNELAVGHPKGGHFPVSPLSGESVGDSATIRESGSGTSVAEAAVARREQPVVESPQKKVAEKKGVEEKATEEGAGEDKPTKQEAIEDEVIEDEAIDQAAPKPEPMAPPELTEAVEVSPEAIGETATEEVLPLTHPIAESGSGAQASGEPADAPRHVAQRNPDQRHYPFTDPSTYQYPSRYEQLLINALHGVHEESHPSTNSSTSIYGWQPNTVRLQPRIEPPPIR